MRHSVLQLLFAHEAMKTFSLRLLLFIISALAVGFAVIAWVISSPVQLPVAHIDPSIVAGDDVIISQAGDTYTLLICTFVSHDEENGTALFRMPWKARRGIYDGGDAFWVHPVNFTLHDSSATPSLQP